jgi:filamentous hemagglutinin family protein
MRIPAWPVNSLIVSIGSILTIALPGSAQIISDGTTGSQVGAIGPNVTITQGTRSGGNLFHSFSEFSIPTGGSARFDNAIDITNIFSRVTGPNVSNIDGMIQTKGAANLFLLNPKGILFGPKAQLNIGGSFLGTTAQSIQFADGNEFSALGSNSPPLLTVTAPIGLNLTPTGGAIQIQGPGHTLTAADSLGLIPLTQSTRPGLQLRPGKTLAFIGNDVSLNNGILGAAQGRVAIGSLTNGSVSFDLSDPKGQMGYSNGSTFGDVSLTGRSLLDVSGVNAGSIQVQGRQINLQGGSVLLSQNLGPKAGGDIQITASQGIQAIGTSTDGNIRTGIYSDTLGPGMGSKITVNAPKIEIQQGASIFAKTFNRTIAGKAATSGDVVITTGLLSIQGVSNLNPSQASSIGAGSLGIADSGQIAVMAQDIKLFDGGALATFTFGTGNSGNIAVMTDTVTVNRTSPLGVPSAIGTTSFGNGNAGSLVLNTRRLQVLNGGGIAATAYATGNAGSVAIKASESIEMDGFFDFLGDRNSSNINSSAIIPSLTVRKLLNLTEKPSGAAGTVEINTPDLSLKDSSVIIVKNAGTGRGGTIIITADQTRIKQNSRLSSETTSGSGGDIILNTDLLSLSQKSTITATAGNQGDGGNIKINSPIIIGLGNSDIIANALKGRGGSIEIATQGILGLKYRDRLTPDNDITASSEFGVNGTVQVNTIGVNPSAELVPLPVDTIDPSQQIAQNCQSSQSSSFVATGRGGLPNNPIDIVNSDRPWNDFRSIPHQPTKSIATDAPHVEVKPLSEATAWQKTQAGEVILLAQQPQPHNRAETTCATR